jgi:hypothetical protein
MAIAENYEEVLKGKYPAKDHARKVAKWIVAKGGDEKGTIYLEAQKQKLNEVHVLKLWSSQANRCRTMIVKLHSGTLRERPRSTAKILA